MKKIAIIFLFFALANSQAQTIDKAKNIISLDFGIIMFPGAAAVGIGLNYERMLNDNISIRGGINIGIMAAGNSGDAVASSGIGIPVTINYMTSSKNKFEIGLGGGPRFDLSDNYNKIRLLPAVKLGYRYQPDEKGMIYRVGLDFPANLYLSTVGIGYHF
ncbi:MAG TPA: hypothetical protein VIK14_10150 [Ignavibacteria bacterium]